MSSLRSFIASNWARNEQAIRVRSARQPLIDKITELRADLEIAMQELERAKARVVNLPHETPNKPKRNGIGRAVLGVIWMMCAADVRTPNSSDIVLGRIGVFIGLMLCLPAGLYYYRLSTWRTQTDTLKHDSAADVTRAEIKASRLTERLAQLCDFMKSSSGANEDELSSRLEQERQKDKETEFERQNEEQRFVRVADAKQREVKRDRLIDASKQAALLTFGLYCTPIGWAILLAALGMLLGEGGRMSFFAPILVSAPFFILFLGMLCADFFRKDKKH